MKGELTMTISPESERIAKTNPSVDLALLQRALEEQKRIVVEQAKYDLEPPFGRRRSSSKARRR